MSTIVDLDVTQDWSESKESEEVLAIESDNSELLSAISNELFDFTNAITSAPIETSVSLQLQPNHTNTSAGSSGSMGMAAQLQLQPQPHPCPLLPEPKPTIQNIVSTVNLGLKLNLKNIVMHCRNAEYNPKRLNAVIMRIREPRTTALIFATGKMVCTGAKNEYLARLSARKFARIIQKIGLKPNFNAFKIHNIVASSDLGFSISLEGLSIAHRNHCCYEAEIFPGLVYRLVEPRIVLLVFVSGKIVLTGARHRQEIFDAFDVIFPVLKQFGKNVPKFQT